MNTCRTKSIGNVAAYYAALSKREQDAFVATVVCHLALQKLERIMAALTALEADFADYVIAAATERDALIDELEVAEGLIVDSTKQRLHTRAELDLAESERDDFFQPTYSVSPF